MTSDVASGLVICVGCGHLATLALAIGVFHARPFTGGIAIVATLILAGIVERLVSRRTSAG